MIQQDNQTKLTFSNTPKRMFNMPLKKQKTKMLHSNRKKQQHILLSALFKRIRIRFLIDLLICCSESTLTKPEYCLLL